VDEVLAVGDIGFQQRCLAKMQEVSNGGRTVFFVSHMMAAITRLCKRVVLIEGGRVVADGPADELVSGYMESILGTGATRIWPEPTAAPGTGAVRLRSVRVRAEDGQVTDEVDIRRPVAIEMQYDVLEPGLMLIPSYQFFNKQGTCLFVSANPMPASRPATPGRYTSTCWIPGKFLAEGTFLATAVISSVDPALVHVFEHHAVSFDVRDNVPGDTVRAGYTGDYPGLVRPLLEWTTATASLPADVALHA
jgi:lipopolysaccharide transport system ATP-binding protein